MDQLKTGLAAMFTTLSGWLAQAIAYATALHEFMPGLLDQLLAFLQSVTDGITGLSGSAVAIAFGAKAWFDKQRAAK